MLDAGRRSSRPDSYRELCVDWVDIWASSVEGFDYESDHYYFEDFLIPSATISTKSFPLMKPFPHSASYALVIPNPVRSASFFPFLSAADTLSRISASRSRYFFT